GTVTETGSMTGGAFNGINVTGVMAGTIVAQGAGTINGFSAGTLSGSVAAVEDPDANPLTGIGSNFSIGTVMETGSMTGGAFNGVSVTGDMAGTIVAQGAGTINGFSAGAPSGPVAAVEDPDANPLTGIGSNFSIGTVTETGSMTGGAFNGITVTGDMGGTIVAQGAGTINGFSAGTLSGSVAA